MDFFMKMDGKNVFIHFQNQDKTIANVNFALRVFLRFSVRNVALENILSAMTGEGKIPRTDLATFSIYKLANSTA